MNAWKRVIAERLARVENRLAELSAKPKLEATIRALRAERVQLQGENESLRNDLARMPAGGPVLGDRDRELLRWLSDDRTLFQQHSHPNGNAVHRLLCRLAQQPVEAYEVARMEDEGGPTPPETMTIRERVEPDRAGWHGTWVSDDGPKAPSIKVGDRVRLRDGTRSMYGVNLNGTWVVQPFKRQMDGHTYTVRVGVAVGAAAGYWIKHEDIVEVVT